LRAVQAQRLAPLQPVWHDDISTLPEAPWFLVANEFLDALPIRQLRWTNDAWRECLVVPDVAGTGLGWGVDRSASPLVGLLPAETREGAAEGTMAELTLAANAITGDIARHVAEFGGAALLIDYGSERRALGGSLQAVRDHRHVDPLADPGLADLSSHVDFSQIRDAAEDGGALFVGPVDQGRFLFGLGIEDRASALKRGGSEGQHRDIDGAMRRLIGTTEMGTLFKVAALLPPGTPDPAGFGSCGAD
jgi:NADH dehydrogenase [ubiquinone] 1 alpha subcomplex assembly factor 7